MSERAFHRDPSPVRIDDGLRDRQPEPGSRDRLIGRPLAAEEAVVEMSLVDGRDSHPGVFDLEHALLVAHRRRNCHRAALRRELDRVRHEVVHHLSKPAPVASQLHRGTLTQPELDPLRIRGRLGRFDALRRKSPQVDVLEVECEHAVLHL